MAQVDTVTGAATFLGGDLVWSTRAATDAPGAVPVQYTASSEVTRADDGAQLAWGADGSLTTRTLGADVTTYASDGLGRRTSATTASGDVTSFAWDQVGRMTGLSDTATGSQTDYTYSGGLRIGAATTVGEDTSTESYAWDTLAGVPLLLSDGGHEYIYGLGSSPVAQVDTATGAVTFLHGDLVGSTRSATDASGTVVGTWDYTPFGVVTAATGGAADDGAGVTRFLFAGEYQDDSGLYFLRARFFDPVTASFLSVDPALAQTGSPYAYASGNPLQLTDPLGLFSLPNPLAGVTNFIQNTVKSLTRGGSVSDMMGTLSCQTSGGFFRVTSGSIEPGATAECLTTQGCVHDLAGRGPAAGAQSVHDLRTMLRFVTDQVGSHYASTPRAILSTMRGIGDWVPVAGYGVSFVATAADGYFYQYADYDMSNRHRLAISIDRAFVEGVASLGGATLGAASAGEVSGGNPAVTAIGGIGGSWVASETAVSVFDGYVATHGSSPVADFVHNIGDAFRNNSPSGTWANFG